MTGNASTRAVGMSAANEPKSPTPMGGASVSEVLAAAADLLEKPGAWTQGTWARDAAGVADPHPERATCWCLYGGIRMVTGFDDPLSDALMEAVRREVNNSPIAWNDAPERTQAEVVDALRQAARQASNPTAEGV